MRKIILINLLIIITGITALGSAVIYKHYREVNAWQNRREGLSQNRIEWLSQDRIEGLSQDRIEGLSVESLINTEREKAGINGLYHSELLCSYANERLIQISANFNHDGFLNTASRFRETHNLSLIGENLSMDTQTDKGTVVAWMNSPTHKANILNPHFTHTCVKCDSKYCVQIFAEPSPTNP